MEKIACKDDMRRKNSGRNAKVQFDETETYNGLVIRYPYSILDERNDIKWVVDEVVQRNYPVYILNLGKYTIKNVFIENFEPGSIIITDRHPSYVSVVGVWFSAWILNHSEGLVQQLVWSQIKWKSLVTLKQNIELEKGVQFMTEYIYFYQNFPAIKK